MTQEDYVSFETAKLLKKKGFDARCSMIYTANGEMLYTDVKHHNMYAVTNKQLEYYTDIIAPTLQMAMKWLREKEWFICIIPLAFYCGEVASQFGYNIWAGDNLEIDEFNTPKFRTYEEACESAIKYCLENLI